MKNARFLYNLFDLDGTLTDPAPGITASVAYALEKLSRPVPDTETLKRFIGPPLVHSFKVYCGIEGEEAKTALRLYRERFAAGGLYENKMYPGIDEVLKSIKAGGGRVILATSKPEEFAAPILEHFGLLKYFDFVAGNTLDEARPEKIQVLRHILENYPDISTDNAVMVGDRSYDALAAKQIGIQTIGVLYGYGSKRELTEAGADMLAKSVKELGAMLAE
ncbi:MAG: HAD hydrolase-like protein [Clostridia bacterium]|nr:HAD hydrolase-like protein [Clostridia bacterium]